MSTFASPDKPLAMTRKLLLRAATGLVEDVHVTIPSRQPSAEDYSSDFQIAFPYSGVFTWHVGRDDVVADSSQILFVTAGEHFRVSVPRPGRYEELILTPSFSVLSEILESTGSGPARHPVFRARSRRATPPVQHAAARLLHWSAGAGAQDALAAEETLLEVLRSALRVEPARVRPSPQTWRLIKHTKEYLGFTFTTRPQLADVARAVGASPAYLTDVFARFEGVSLARYITQLRLGRALIALPSADNLSRLALELGFSSHSHFSIMFRRAFGCTPSEFRATTRRSARSMPAPPASGSSPGKLGCHCGELPLERLGLTAAPRFRDRR